MYNNINFNGNLHWSKALKETSEHAKAIGQYDTYKEIRTKVRSLNEHHIHITHHYHKKDDVTRSQFKFIKHGKPEIFIATDGKIKNPAELTFKYLKDLLNPLSTIYKKIYG